MGYSSRAVELLISYFLGEMTINTISPSTHAFGGQEIGNKFNQEAIQRSEDELGQAILQHQKKLFLEVNYLLY